MKQTYEKAKAKVVLFDNSDVVTLSNGENAAGGCTTKTSLKAEGKCFANGHDKGYGCPEGLSGVDEW